MKKRSVECVDCHQEHQLTKQKSLNRLNKYWVWRRHNPLCFSQHGVDLQSEVRDESLHFRAHMGWLHILLVEVSECKIHAVPDPHVLNTLPVMEMREGTIHSFPSTHGFIARPISGSEWLQNPCSGSTRVDYPTHKWRWENGQAVPDPHVLFTLPISGCGIWKYALHEFPVHMTTWNWRCEKTLSMSFQFT